MTLLLAARCNTCTGEPTPSSALLLLRCDLLLRRCHCETLKQKQFFWNSDGAAGVRSEVCSISRLGFFLVVTVDARPLQNAFGFVASTIFSIIPFGTLCVAFYLTLYLTLFEFI
jgi:hypothetical protein